MILMLFLMLFCYCVKILWASFGQHFDIMESDLGFMVGVIKGGGSGSSRVVHHQTAIRTPSRPSGLMQIIKCWSLAR